MAMKKLALAAAFALPFAAAAAPENYTLDPYHTYTHWEVEHLGVSMWRGRFNRNAGKFILDRAAKTGSVELVVQTASVDSGDNDRGKRPRTLDDHLKTADFFNVAEFPQMTFKSTAVKFSGDNPTEIEGQLTMVGVTKPLHIKIDRWVCKDHPVRKAPMCGGNASAVLKRSDWGMKYGIPNVSDEVRLFFQFEGYRD